MNDPRSAGPAALTLRLLATLLLILLVAAACFALVARSVIDTAREQQLQDARSHFAARIGTLDQGWRLAAYSVRQQVELWQAGGTAAVGVSEADRLRALLLTLSDQSDFTHAVVVDVQGEVLFRQGTRTRDAPALPPPNPTDSAGWVHSQADRTVYRTVAGPLVFGGRSAQLVLYFPVDNAALGRLVYPSTQLQLLSGNEVVAVSAPIASAVAGGAVAEAVLSWDNLAGAPRLRVLRQFVSPLSDRLVPLVALACVVAFAGLGWLVLGRWVSAQARRLRALQQVSVNFAGAASITPPMQAQLQAAESQPDDIGLLAGAMRQMMERVAEAQRQQAQARDALSAANVGLESRVAERTHELERARDEALAAARAKEQFLSNMSHEIRTPMNGMLGALELLSNTSLNAAQTRYIEVASTSGEALLGVINEVLDFAKIGSGRLELSREPIDLHAVARTVTTLFAASAQRKGLELRLQADPSLAGWRLGDALRVRQVLLNLVGNALKFTQSGEIVVSTSRAGPGDLVRITVSDTGPGIDPAQHGAIFEAFVQASQPSQRAQGGTGLGLAIGRQLARAMGGDLTVQSVPGQGASFHFTLPLPPSSTPGRATAMPAPGDSAAMPGTLRGRVLLVEDNSVNRLVGTAMLNALGIEVLEAENGEEGLAALSRTSVDLVLMDCQMPVMDGYEATHRLREAERLQGLPRLPVVAFTANALSGDVERCLAAGMDAHLPKPFTMEQLHETLAPWLATRRSG